MKRPGANDDSLTVQNAASYCLVESKSENTAAKCLDDDAVYLSGEDLSGRSAGKSFKAVFGPARNG